MDDKNNKNSVNDFEMGDDQDPSVQPKINRYTDETKPTTESIIKPEVDPSAAAPEPTSTTAPAPEAPTPAPAPATQPMAPTPVVKASAPSSNPEAKRKALLGCFGAFGGLLLILLILSFVFISQSGGVEDTSAIAGLLGVNQGVFVNGLITFVHIIFIIIALTTFIFTMIGLFKASMAKKGDLLARKSGLKMSGVSGATLILILIIWAFAYLYLDAKRVPLPDEILDPIITQPEETLNLSAPVEVKFDASNVPINKKKYQIVAHEWDFGDDTTGTNQITSHIYKEKGIYNVGLVVKVKDQETGEIIVGGEYGVTVSIANEALKAIFSASPQSGEAPLKVEFDASESVDPDGTIDRYLWDLNEDGQFDDDEGAKIDYEFKKIGKYKVALQVVSTTGESDIVEKEIVVQKGEEPVPVITVVDNPTTFTNGVNYTFKADESTSPNGKIEKYEWDFGDGGKVQKTKTVTHVFDKAGTYELTLKVTDEDSKEGEVSKIIKVSSPKGTPKAQISTTPELSGNSLTLEGKAPFQVSFNGKQSTDSDNNIVDYEWDFGDDSAPGAGDSTSHVFKNEGTYSVTLSVTDADNNVGKTTVIIKASAQGINPALDVDKIEGNVPLTVTFDASGSTYSKGQITSYKWDFGDGGQPKLGNAKISHKYTSIGTFTATVTVIGADNTSATKTANITVREIPLQACFKSVFEKGPAPLDTTFDPSCSTGTVTKYLWDFGDGSSSTTVKPSHTFDKAGSYNVTLEVSDAENTIDQFELTINVTE